MTHSRIKILIIKNDPVVEISEKQIKFFRKSLIDWFKNNGRDFPWRRSGVTEYESIIVELLLQRTKAVTVAKVYSGFISKFPSWDALDNADDLELEKYLKPIGLWKRRKVSIKELTQEMVKLGGNFPSSYDEIIELPGIGQYIGNAIMIFTKQKNYPLLDSNMARILERFFHKRKLADIRDDPFLQGISFSVVQKVDPKIINWAIIDVASTICKIKKPQCQQCPIREQCSFYNNLARLIN